MSDQFVIYSDFNCPMFVYVFYSSRRYSGEEWGGDRMDREGKSGK